MLLFNRHAHHIGIDKKLIKSSIPLYHQYCLLKSHYFSTFCPFLFLKQAFQGHKLHNVLKDPGSADVTADVDFSYLKEVAGDQGKLIIFGVTNVLFLWIPNPPRVCLEKMWKWLLWDKWSSQFIMFWKQYKRLWPPSKVLFILLWKYWKKWVTPN